jgi:ubiquinone/menaquinone biosynthesis C-methylase UbiE
LLPTVESSMETTRFDQIAEIYDETRRELDQDSLNGIKGMLEKNQCHSVLEIGVGTGRISFPLFNAGYEVIGVDVSKNMLVRAKMKGLRSLFLASGNRLPFKNRTFDASLFAHVLHVVDDPPTVLKEASRVSKTGIFALVRKQSENHANRYSERRERFKKIAEKYGWRSYQARPARYFQKEQEILEKYPPDELKIVSHLVINMTIEETIARFEKGGFSFMDNMPEGMKQEVVREMRDNPKDWTRPRDETYQVALWKSETIATV